MKYIDHPATSELNVLIDSIDYNQARCIGRLEIYSCKTVPVKGNGGESGWVGNNDVGWGIVEEEGMEGCDAGCMVPAQVLQW